MKGYIFLLAATAAVMPAMASTPDFDQVINRLGSAGDYHSTASVNVQLPQGTEVTYDINMWSTVPAGNRHLAPSDYLIEWTLPTPDGEAKGFTAYSDGHLFRQTDTRLQEYHFEWDSIPFLLNDTRSGVQRNAQFTNLLPQFIAEDLTQIKNGDNWTYRFTPDTINNGKPAMVLTGRMIINDYIGKNVLYIFDPETCMPRHIEIENNPTQISEQLLVIKYGETSEEAAPALTEQQLAARYPSVFDHYRENNFSIETLRGKVLPGFSLPSLTGERYQRQKGDPMASPTVIAFIDPTVETVHQTVEAMRQAVDMNPRSTDLIFANITTDIDGAEEITGSPRRGEYMLMSARSLARDCGVTSYPTFIVVDTQGNVSDIIIGFSNSLATSLLEKLAIAQ